MLPKIHSVEDLEIVAEAMEAIGTKGIINFVASIESARALYNIGTIAAWRSVYGPEKGGKLAALLVISFITSRGCYHMLTHPLASRSSGQKTVCVIPWLLISGN